MSADNLNITVLDFKTNLQNTNTSKSIALDFGIEAILKGLIRRLFHES